VAAVATTALAALAHRAALKRGVTLSPRDDGHDMTDWLIQNARIVNEGQVRDADVRVRAGRIETIAGTLTAKPGERVYDARGRTLLPGLIDDQVHFREPGMEYKADIASESRAAVAGGITSFMDMPNTKPPAITRAALEDKFARGAKSALANYSFYMGTTNDNLDEIRALSPGQTCGLKVFMGASTGNMLVDDPTTLDGIFRDAPTLIITHCEDTPTIDANLAAEKARGTIPDATRHPYIRSREACIKSTLLAQALARQHDARLHVLHISTAEEVDLFEAGDLAKQRITAETCVHFLHFDASDYAERGNFIKCNPAIKFATDRAAIIRGVADGRLAVLATDHAPHTLAEKELPYEQAPSGLPLVQHALQCALERVLDGDFDIATLVARFCHAPAILFGIEGRGYLREGYWADLALVDLAKPHGCTRDTVLSKCGWSPFEGITFRSTPIATWVNGHLAWNEGEFDDSQLGQRLVTRRGRA
jgi:dihydroorotase